jgi:hypothetical protein
MRMIERGDGVLRLPAMSFDIGSILAERANAFLSAHPGSESDLRRLFTLRLATIREDGEPVRRRAPRSEFTDKEWRLVSELADHPNRLLVTVTREDDETHTEVAHEAIFRRSDRLRDWIASERRVPCLEEPTRIAASLLGTGAGGFEERRVAHGPRASAGAKLGCNPFGRFVQCRSGIYRSQYEYLAAETGAGPLGGACRDHGCYRAVAVGCSAALARWLVCALDGIAGPHFAPQQFGVAHVSVGSEN